MGTVTPVVDPSKPKRCRIIAKTPFIDTDHGPPAALSTTDAADVADIDIRKPFSGPPRIW